MTRLSSSLLALVAASLLAPSAQAGSAKPAFPSWSQRIDTAKRFTVLAAFGGAAVLDNETGLVWEQAPSADGMAWSNAPGHCNRVMTGGRLGWRVPAVQELASLLDPGNASGNPDLPPGHPFSDVQATVYWSANGVASDEDAAWAVSFENGQALDTGKASPYPVWCVRGGQGVDLQ